MKAPFKPFGRAVRLLREQAEYSQERFAAAAGIDRTYMSEIERGLANPSLEMIGRIVHTLGIGFADLFAGVDRELGGGRHE
jgi:transcriptional regulator with XRE-family HTH domain